MAVDVVQAIDKLPVIPGIFEFVGIVVTGVSEAWACIFSPVARLLFVGGLDDVVKLLRLGICSPFHWDCLVFYSG